MSEGETTLGQWVQGYDPALGERLSLAVARIGTQKEAAAVAGVTDEQIGRWKRGQAKPAFYGIVALAKAAGVSLDWLATGEGPREDRPRPTQSREKAVDTATVSPTAADAAPDCETKITNEHTESQPVCANLYSFMQDDSFKARMKHLADLMGGPERLAEAAGLSRRVIDKYRLGESEPSRERLVKLAAAGGISLTWLATGQGAMQGEGPNTSPRHATAPDAYARAVAAVGYSPPALTAIVLRDAVAVGDLPEARLHAILRALKNDLDGGGSDTG